jgi:hypothetical protein
MATVSRVMSRRTKATAAAAVGIVALVVLSGCGGSGKTSRAASTTVTVPKRQAAPPPPFARVVPPSYRAQRVWRASLTGGSVPEAIISSVGPLTGSLGFHPADLQVLSWDAITRRWTVLFDAEKVTASAFFSSPQTSNNSPVAFSAAGGTDTTPLLDPKADVTIGQVRFAPLVPGHGEQLIFSASATYGGSGVPGTLVIVDFHGGIANLAYVWSGDGGASFRIEGSRIIATAAEFWTSSDSHCCPTRSYGFTIGRRGKTNYLTELTDERPWLGVYLEPVNKDYPQNSPVRVLGVVDGSPAASVLRPGDILLSLKNAPKIRNPAKYLLGPVIYDQIDTLNAGETADLLVSRNRTQITLTVKLGSLSDASVMNASPPNSYTVNTL